MSKTEPLVEVYRANGESEALVIKSLLDSYDIPSVITSNAAPSVLVFPFEAMGPVKVMVKQSKAVEAMRIIEESDTGMMEELPCDDEDCDCGA